MNNSLSHTYHDKILTNTLQHSTDSSSVKEPDFNFPGLVMINYFSWTSNMEACKFPSHNTPELNVWLQIWLWSCTRAVHCSPVNTRSPHGPLNLTLSPSGHHQRSSLIDYHRKRSCNSHHGRLFRIMQDSHQGLQLYNCLIPYIDYRRW